MDKVYLILGASSDLGCALIQNILKVDEPDYRIIAHYHSTDEHIKSIIRNRKENRVETIQSDLSDTESTKRFIDQVAATGLYPSHIINFSANAYKFNRLREMDIQRLNRDMTIQVYSFAMICQAFVPHMAEKNYGKIVAMLSAATKGVPPKNTIEYTTVKYALLGVVKSLAADYGDCGINVNAVSPGMIETKFIKNIGRKIKEFTAEKNPQHRNLSVDDVIPIIMFLLSEECQFMNGTNINLSGIPD